MTEDGRSGARRRAVVHAAALLALTTACAAEPVPVAEFERTTGVAAPPQPDPAAVAGREGPAAPDFARPPGVALPEGAGPGPRPERRSERTIGFGDGELVASSALSRRGGEAGLAELTLYDGYGIVTTLSPNGDVDRVVVRGGGPEAPTALPGSVVREGDAARYSVADVRWDLIPALVERTPGDLGVEGGEVSHVTVTKNLPFSPDLVIRVYVTSERDGGRIDYFADGRPMRAFRD